MNEFKRPIGTTRIKRLEQENETLRQARDRAIEAAAKNRLIAETALVALLPRLDVSRCDAADLESIQTFMEETGHLSEMAEVEPLNLIRSLLESMDSEELHYIRIVHQSQAFIRQLETEQLRLLAIKEILKSRALGGNSAAGYRLEQLKAVNVQMGWMLDNTPAYSFSVFLSDSHYITQVEIDREILNQQQICQRKESSENAQQKQASEVPAVQQPVES